MFVPWSHMLFAEVAEWSEKTFGSRGPIGSLKHLKKEIDEILADPTDKVEFADAQILLFDAAWRAGISHDELFQIAFDKMEVNRDRIYPAVVGDEPCEHDRSFD